MPMPRFDVGTFRNVAGDARGHLLERESLHRGALHAVARDCAGALGIGEGDDAVHEDAGRDDHLGVERA